MPDQIAPDAARLAVARHAARLFLERGVAGTSGDDIAEAAGISKRTVWRYFRTKEECITPLFMRASLQFGARLRAWPREASLEDHLADCLAFDKQSQEDIADGILVVRLVALLPDEPDIVTAWLLAERESERQLAPVIAARLGLAADAYEVRFCAALVAAAMRIVDETVSVAAIRHGQVFTTAEIIDQLARAIRTASTLPFCDPVPTKPFGDGLSPRGG